MSPRRPTRWPARRYFHHDKGVAEQAARILEKAAKDRPGCLRPYFEARVYTGGEGGWGVWARDFCPGWIKFRVDEDQP